MTVEEFIKCIQHLSDTCPEIRQAQLCNPSDNSPNFQLELRLGDQVSPWNIVNDWEMHRWFYEATKTKPPAALESKWKEREIEQHLLFRLKKAFPDDLLFIEDDPHPPKITRQTIIMDAQNALVNYPSPMVVLRYKFPTMAATQYADMILHSPIWNIAFNIANRNMGRLFNNALAMEMKISIRAELDEFLKRGNMAGIDTISVTDIHFITINDFIPSRTVMIVTLMIIA